MSESRKDVLLKAIEAEVGGATVDLSTLFTDDVVGWSPYASVSGLAELAVVAALREVAFTNDNRYSPLPQDGQPLLTSANGLCFAVAVTKDTRKADVIFLERADDQDGGPSGDAWLYPEVIFHGSSPNGAPRLRKFLPSPPPSGPGQRAAEA